MNKRGYFFCKASYVRRRVNFAQQAWVNLAQRYRLKAYGKSKHKRDDLPQVTIGLAVTREGIPVRCWVLQGNQHDSQCVDQVQKDFNSWNLGRVVWVMDRGMTSDENRRLLQRVGGKYIWRNIPGEG